MKKKLGLVLLVVALALALVLPAAPVAASPDSIVGLWHCDVGSGTTVTDSSGNGNDGTLNLGTLGNTNPANAWVDLPPLGTISGMPCALMASMTMSTAATFSMLPISSLSKLG